MLLSYFCFIDLVKSDALKYILWWDGSHCSRIVYPGGTSNRNDMNNLKHLTRTRHDLSLLKSGCWLSQFLMQWNLHWAKILCEDFQTVVSLSLGDWSNTQGHPAAIEVFIAWNSWWALDCVWCHSVLREKYEAKPEDTGTIAITRKYVLTAYLSACVRVIRGTLPKLPFFCRLAELKLCDHNTKARLLKSVRMAQQL